MQGAIRALLLVLIVGAIAGFYFLFAPETSMENMTDTFTLSSPVFEDGDSIPSKYTCDEDRLLSPPLSISGVPEGVQSLVLVADDPDIPEVFKQERGIEAFDHWVVYAIPPETTEIPEGASVGSAGLNSAGNAAYTGPCPPSEYEPSEHRYIFTLYALSGTLNFITTPSKAEVLAAIEGMTIVETSLTGLYKRK